MLAAVGGEAERRERDWQPSGVGGTLEEVALGA